MRIKTLLAGFAVALGATLFVAAPASAGPALPTQETAAAAETAGTLAVPPPPGPGQCGPYFTITTSGARATVRECRNNSNQIQVNGRATDTDADGQCAQVYASYNIYRGTDYGPRACPSGTTVTFTFPWRAGTDAFIYLREFA
ncbi:MAG TPA: hypothetical protein VNV66_02720 [Pilimelia sp.]|nr:hypothetical protein [Pilimelia sp.]